jgi:hypothetical protein
MRLPKYLTIALSLAALLVLVAAGCGGGGGGSESTAATEATTEAAPKLTKAELISQGDAICGEVNAAVGSVGASAASTQSQIEQVATLYTGMVSSINELGTPKENPAEYSEFTGAAEELAKVESEIKLAAEREDTTAIGEAATEAASALENFQSTATVYGFEACGQGPSAPASAPSSGSGAEGEEEGGVEVAPEIEEVAPEEVAPEEVVPETETGGAGGGIEEVAPEEGGGGTESGGGGVGPG